MNFRLQVHKPISFLQTCRLFSVKISLFCQNGDKISLFLIWFLQSDGLIPELFNYFLKMTDFLMMTAAELKLCIFPDNGSGIIIMWKNSSYSLESIGTRFTHLNQIIITAYIP